MARRIAGRWPLGGGSKSTPKGPHPLPPRERQRPLPLLTEVPFNLRLCKSGRQDLNLRPLDHQLCSNSLRWIGSPPKRAVQYPLAVVQGHRGPDPARRAAMTGGARRSSEPPTAAARSGPPWPARAGRRRPQQGCQRGRTAPLSATGRSSVEVSPAGDQERSTRATSALRGRRPHAASGQGPAPPAGGTVELSRTSRVSGPSVARGRTRSGHGPSAGRRGSAGPVGAADGMMDL